MFTVEIKINGTMIAHVYGHNLGDIGKGLTEYEYEYYETASRTVKAGTVKHQREDGIAPLVAMILLDAHTQPPIKKGQG